MSDYISREAAIEKIREAGCTDCGGSSGTICGFCDFENAVRLVNGLPTADVEPVRRVAPICLNPDEYYGKWLLCPSCGFDLNAWGAKFCGGCGAKMDLENNDEN